MPDQSNRSGPTGPLGPAPLSPSIAHVPQTFLDSVGLVALAALIPPYMWLNEMYDFSGSIRLAVFVAVLGFAYSVRTCDQVGELYKRYRVTAAASTEAFRAGRVLATALNAVCKARLRKLFGRTDD